MKTMQYALALLALATFPCCIKEKKTALVEFHKGDMQVRVEKSDKDLIKIFSKNNTTCNSFSVYIWQTPEVSEFLESGDDQQ